MNEQTLRIETPEMRQERRERQRIEFEGRTEFYAYGATSQQSLDHVDNQDAVDYDAEDDLFLVADGVGSCLRAEEASGLAIDYFVENFQRPNLLAAKDQRYLFEELVNAGVCASLGTATSRLKRQNLRKEYSSMPEKILQTAYCMQEAALAANNILIKGDAEGRSLGTTLSVTKLVRVQEGHNTRIFGIFLTIGDSKTFLKRTGRPLEKPAISDSSLEIGVRLNLPSFQNILNSATDMEERVMKLEKWSRENSGEMINGKAVKDLAWSSEQLMGFQRQADDLQPRIAIRELYRGDKIMMATDGITDNDDLCDIEETLGENISPMEKSRKTLKRSTQKSQTGEPYKGSDDATDIVIEII